MNKITFWTVLAFFFSAGTCLALMGHTKPFVGFVSLGITCICGFVLMWIALGKSIQARDLQIQVKNAEKKLYKAGEIELKYIRIIAMKDIGMFDTADTTPLVVMARLKQLPGGETEMKHFLGYYMRWIAERIGDVKTYGQLNTFFHTAGIDHPPTNMYARIIGGGVIDKELNILQHATIANHRSFIRNIVSKDWETAPEERKNTEQVKLVLMDKEHIFRKLKLEELISKETV